MNEGAVLLIHLSSLLWGLGALAFVGSSAWLSAMDLSRRMLPNRLVGWGTGATLGLFAASSAVQLPTPLIGSALRDLGLLVGGAAALFALFYLLWRFAPSGIGGGDVKVAPLVGGVLGFLGGFWAVCIGAVIACAFAAIWAALLRRGGSMRDRAVPFAPCLFAGAWVVILAAPLVGRVFSAG